MKLGEGKFDVRRAAYWTVSLAGAVFAFWVFTRYLAVILLPFLLAWGMAFLVRPAAVAIRRRFGLPERAGRVVLVLALLCGIGGGAWLLCARLFAELKELVQYLSAHPDIVQGYVDRTEAVLERVRNWFPAFQRSGEPVRWGAWMDTLLTQGAQALTTQIPQLLGSVLRALPRVLLFVLVTLIAALYMSYDLQRVNRCLMCLVPARWQERVRCVRQGLGTTMGKYVRSYLLLMCIMMGLLLTGFLLLRVPYALLLALVFSVLDLLPVIGVGTLLVPWSVYCLAVGDLRLGAGLLVMYGAIAVLRQLLEPKILGASLGIHPLLTLLAMYAGYCLFGIAGLLLGPVIGVGLKSLLHERMAAREEKNADKTKAPCS